MTDGEAEGRNNSANVEPIVHAILCSFSSRKLEELSKELVQNSHHPKLRGRELDFNVPSHGRSV